MRYVQEDDKVVLTDFSDFDITETLECGQCFRFDKTDEDEFVVIAVNKVIYIKQYGMERVEFYPCTVSEFENIWIKYFDLDRDYIKIKEILSEDDSIMKEAIEFASGIRILNQEPYECLISFIISQNNRIPMIKKVIENISREYGNDLRGGYYSFPAAEVLNRVSEEELMKCKTGFRAKYIKDAVEKLSSGEILIENLKDMETDELRRELLNIHGVGPKVADCTMLFSMGKGEVFPIDVWVRRVMQYFYFNDEEVSMKKIHTFADEKWGEYAGFAQQYLFHYARIKQIGKK